MSKVPKDASTADVESILNLRRAYTTGGKLGARKMFVFNEDGTIAGLQKVEPKKEGSPRSTQKSKKDKKKDKKFGKLSSKMSVSAMSVGGESKVAFSDADYMPEEGQEEGARIGNMRGKPGVTIWNLLLVPGLLFFSLLSGADVMQSMALILKDENYFNRTQDEASIIAANSLAYAQIMAIPIVLVIGFLYDIIGRKLTTVLSFILGAISTILIPILSPSILGYDIARVLFCQSMVIMLSNPFINDYVTVQSRGVATGFQTIGLTVGNLLSVGGVLTVTDLFTNKLYSYGILALM